MTPTYEVCQLEGCNETIPDAKQKHHAKYHQDLCARRAAKLRKDAKVADDPGAHIEAHTTHPEPVEPVDSDTPTAEQEAQWATEDAATLKGSALIAEVDEMQEEQDRYDKAVADKIADDEASRGKSLSRAQHKVTRRDIFYVPNIEKGRCRHDVNGFYCFVRDDRIEVMRMNGYDYASRKRIRIPAAELQAYTGFGRGGHNPDHLWRKTQVLMRCPLEIRLAKERQKIMMTEAQTPVGIEQAGKELYEKQGMDSVRPGSFGKQEKLSAYRKHRDLAKNLIGVDNTE